MCEKKFVYGQSPPLKGNPVPSAYHALDYADADGMERKATIVRTLESRIGELGITRSEAAERLGLEKIELDRILRGVLRRYDEPSLAFLRAKLG